MTGCQVTSERSRSEKANAEESWTVNDILREFGPAYLAKHQSKMSADQIKVLHALMACRTEKLGCAVFRCQQCQKDHFFPKSCGNRHCPSCQGSKAKDWLIEQHARLLPCNYFMLTFTVPAEMRKFIRSHPKECLRALFGAVRDLLYDLASDSRWIGSPHLGFVSVLHTWGRDLNYHPHIHCIVPGGALSPSGNEWLPRSSRLSRSRSSSLADLSSEVSSESETARIVRISTEDRLATELGRALQRCRRWTPVAPLLSSVCVSGSHRQSSHCQGAQACGRNG
jgi:hypothetical protein